MESRESRSEPQTNLGRVIPARRRKDGNVGIVEGPKSLTKDDGSEYDSCVAATQDKEYKATE